MFSLHVISDLDLEFNEFTPKTEENIPDVDCVILNGNIGKHPKRGMRYVEELCEKYPQTQFVYNYGFHEYYPKGSLQKNTNEVAASLVTRQNFNKNWPNNLHCFLETSKQIKLRTGYTIDVFCAFGYPKINSYTGNWEDTIWNKFVVAELTRDINDPRLNLPKETSRVSHGEWPIWATPEWLNDKNQTEYQKIKKWEVTYDANSGYKILVTHINPLRDSRLENQKVEFFNIHLNNRLWVTANTKIEKTQYLGSKLISNPGRGQTARSSVEHITF